MGSINHSKIAILSTVINFDLYHKSAQLFPNIIQKYVIDGRNGMHGLQSIFYMMKKLRGRSIDWLVMADEDVLFQSPDLVFEIIQKMEMEQYTVCGVRDGGILSHRTYNPFLINTFFSIVNFKEIESLWDKKKVVKNNFFLENEFDDDITELRGLYDVKSLYEPYYIFYLWLRRNNKQFLFLDSNHPFQKDQITNTVYFENKILLHHTWYARAYGNNEKHTKRIDTIFNLLNFENCVQVDPIIFKHKWYYYYTRGHKMFRKIVRIFR
ncbi:hypothetical protein [Flavobacterium sp.]|uniref:hypothetical protein n=1 Tax=Flavobacterium sp. TaxID=239 RepID=UPI0026239C42|nr:hypothetical protein [Flavobacterium sp.]